MCTIYPQSEQTPHPKSQEREKNKHQNSPGKIENSL